MKTTSVINGIPAEWYAVNDQPDSPKGIRLTPPKGTNRCQISIAIKKAMMIEGCTVVDLVGDCRKRWAFGHGKHQ